MADEEQVELLKKGMEGWNKWREENPGIEINLYGANLSGANLSGANLSGANLSGAILIGANLSGANLSGAILIGADFSESILNGSVLAGAIIGGTIFRAIDLSETIGLDEVEHRESSIIGIDTLQLSKKQISAKFLIRCGFITQKFISELLQTNQTLTTLEPYSKEDLIKAQYLIEKMREGEIFLRPGYTDQFRRNAKSGESTVQEVETESKARREYLRKHYKISTAHPKLLSKRYSSRFLVQIYLPEMRPKALRTLAREFKKQETTENVQESDLETGQVVRLKFSCTEITFSDSIVLRLGKSINATNFLAKPDDNCHPGVHLVILSISDFKTQVEVQSIPYRVRVADFAFDHVSRPFLSKALSVVIGVGSLIMFALTLLGQIDTTLGLTSGTVAGILAGGIFLRFLSPYIQPKIVNEPYSK